MASFAPPRPWIATRGLTCALALLPLCRIARADPSVEVRIDGSAGGCPSVAAVEENLTLLLPAARVATVEGGEEAARVEDLGGSYRVRFRGREQEYVDAARRCDARARAVAVFLALALDPPSVAAGTGAAPAAASVTAAVEAQPRFPVAVEAGAAIDMAPGGFGHGQPIAGGGAARIVGGLHRHLAIGLGLAAGSPTTIDLPTGHAELLRVPFDLSLRAMLRRGRVELAVELGPSLAILIATGRDLPVSSRDAGAELGLRGALLLKLHLGRRLAPFLAIQATYLARATEIAVDGRGVVTTAPSAWLGALLGIAARVR